MQADNHGLTPGSAVVLVGDNPVSATPFGISSMC
jgi:hypothetical protein